MKKDRTAGNSDWYLQIFNEIEKNLNGAGKQKIHQIRKNAISHFHNSGFPRTKDEEWKYTDISPLTEINFDFCQMKYCFCHKSFLIHVIQLSSHNFRGDYLE